MATDNHIADESGFFDNESCRMEPAGNPVEAKVLTMCPEQTADEWGG